MEEKELIKGLEVVDFYFIEKTYLPTCELRVAIRKAIDYIKKEEAKKIALGNVGP
jgi:hypothetical protein